MTQSWLKFAPYGTSLQPSVATTSRKYFGNYGNNKPARGGSTFAIRRVALPRPKTYHPPEPMHPLDVAELLQGRWPGHFICAEGRYVKGDADTGWTPAPTAVRASSSGRVRHRLPYRSRRDAREAADADYDVLTACASSYEAHASEFGRSGAAPSSRRA